MNIFRALMHWYVSTFRIKAVMQMLSIARIAKRTAGELITRVSRDTRELTQFITGDLGNIIEQVVTLLAVSIVLFSYDWRLALMIILACCLIIVAVS